MKLIIDAGSTKTATALIGPATQVDKSTSIGMNPITDEDFDEKIISMLDRFKGTSISQVFYYGAGCINRELSDQVRALVHQVLGDTVEIEAESDIVGAARSLSGNEPAIIAILGTGSNIAYYNGKTIEESLTSGGYLLGDEGSGFRFGQAIFRSWIRGQLTSRDNQLIEKSTGCTREKALRALYSSEDPRSFLARLSATIGHISQKNAQLIIDEVLDRFIDQMVLPLHHKYREPVHIVGSVGYHFKSTIRKKLNYFNIIAGSIIPAPLDGLIAYHHES